MRFQQLVRKFNASLKKKMYKSGKNWIVKSTLGFAGGLALFGVTQNTIVRADPVDDNSQLTSTQGTNQDDTSVSKSNILATSISKGAPQVSTGIYDNDDVTLETSGAGQQPKDNSTTSPKAAEPSSGTIGGANWELNTDNNLNISAGKLDEITSSSDPWGTSGDYLRNTVTSITIGNNDTDSSTGKLVAGQNVSGLFKGFKNVTAINGLSNFDVGQTENLSELFSGCSNLTSLDLSLMNTKQTAEVENMLEGDTNIDTLTLSPNTNLTDTGLDVGQHDEENGYMWSVNGLTPKNTKDLVSLYNGNSAVTNITTWNNYAPFTIKIIGEDTNGKELGSPAVIHKPIDSKGEFITSDSDYLKKVTDFDKKVSEISSNGTIILDESGNQPVSRLYSPYITPDNEAAEKDSQGVLFLPFKNFLGERTVDEYFNLLALNSVQPYLSGVEYTYHLVYPAKKTSNSGSGSSSTPNRNIEGIEEKIATYVERPDVQLYDDNGSIITDRKLAPNSDWFTDESMQLNKDKFYRVATNQWAKANDVYLYYPNESKVQVKSGAIATLVTDEGKTVTDRALQPLSNWYTDKYIYLNDVKYYRVATNEFVSSNDVTEY